MYVVINAVGGLNVTGPVHITNTTPNTVCGNGALVVAGGASIGQNLTVVR